jgi:hypothetical protein
VHNSEMSDVGRVPCKNCGLMMLRETGAKTGGVCMRCAGAGRDAVRTNQRTQGRPTPRTRKRRTALALLDLQTYPVWVAMEDDKVRPLCSGEPPQFGEVIVSATFNFRDGSTYHGAISAVLTRRSVGFRRPFLLSAGSRIELSDGWPEFSFGGVSFTYDSMTEALSDRLRREFQQQLARAEGHIGKKLEASFPVEFILDVPLRRSTPLRGALQLPTFHLPIALGQSMASHKEILDIRSELEIESGRWIIVVASAYADRRDLFEALLSAYRRWSVTKEGTVGRVDVLLLANRKEPAQADMLRYLADRWNKARKPNRSCVIDVCLGSDEQLWFGFTNEASGASGTTKAVRTLIFDSREK